MKKSFKKGFTIVELLIVIIVIGILVAITVVSYAGVTAKGNTSSAQSAANQVIKKAEIYSKEPASQGSTGTYPLTLAVLTGAGSDKSYQVTGVTYGALGAQPASPSTVRMQICGVTSVIAQAGTYSAVASGVITGVRVYYWDYQKNLAQNQTDSVYTTGTVEGSGVYYPGTSVLIKCYDTSS